MESNSNPARSASYSKLNDYNQSNSKPPLTARQSSLARWKCIFVGLVIISCIICIGLGIGFGLSKIHNKKLELNAYYFVHTYQNGAVSSQSPQCSKVGRDILKEGGSAVDAAIAALLCEGAYSPHSAGLGGGFLMTVFNKSTGVVRVIDARETAPGRATRDMYRGNQNASRQGGLAVAVPGEIRGYQLAHSLYGRLDWSKLFEPAIRICRKGILISKYVAGVMKNKAKADIYKEPSMRSVFVNNETGELFQAGDIIPLPDLARTLEIIATKGPDEFYTGVIAENLINDLRNFGSIIEPEDLKNYKAIVREPVRFPLEDGNVLYSVPPPGSGLILGLLMNILDKFKFDESSVDGSIEDQITFYHRFVEACKYAYAKRGDIGDPAFANMQNLTYLLESPELASKIRSLISDASTFGQGDYFAAFKFASDHGTAQVSVMTPDGDAVSATSTVNTWFGAIIRSPSTGIILNNQMDDFSTPDAENFYGLPPSEVNFIQPGKRPASSMAPSIVLNANGEVLYSFGGSGGSKIISASAYVYLLHKHLNRTMEDAIIAPRIHHQLFPNYIQLEDVFPEEIREGLKEKGHDVTGTDFPTAMHVIFREKDGQLRAAADYRRHSSPAGF